MIEPFGGSGAVTLAAAARGIARRYVLSDSLPALAGIWQAIVDDPGALADRYQGVWSGAGDDPRGWYDRVRAGYNADGDPAALLYLLARCVKNSVRFNAEGRFNQSPDRRRLGTHPTRMRAAILGAHGLLQGRTTVSARDYAQALADATPRDLVYLDPPYEGTSTGRDRRYAAPLDRARFITVLGTLRARAVPFLVSFDGRTGPRTYGAELPADLGLTRIDLRAGRSTQATLHGRAEETVESLYLSPGLTPPRRTRRAQ